MRIAVLVLLGALGLEAFPDGADPRACVSMIPQHQRYRPQTSRPPYEIEVSSTSYNERRDKLQVTLKAKSGTFKGFMLQARSADWDRSGNEPLGTFNTPAGTKEVCRSATGAGVTHESSNNKAALVFTWTPSPNTKNGHIVFVATFVDKFDTFWSMVPSKQISEVNTEEIKEQPVPYAIEGTSLSASVAGCGKSNGCFRQPSRCGDNDEPGCEYFLSWKASEDSVTFTMSGIEKGYVAMGLSDDSRMGDDSIIACVRNPEKTSEFWLEHGITDGKSYERRGGTSNTRSSLAGLELLSASSSNGRLTCSFKRNKVMDGQKSLDDSWRLLMAAGPAENNDAGEPRIRRHSMTTPGFPVHSSGRINFLQSGNESASRRYHLAKIHGILMILAWILCASIAIVLALYYKDMWPGTRPGGERTWFQMHRGLQIANLVLTIFAFILIFIEVGGYSKVSGSPQYVHPILGIVVTILVILNPLMALIRCKPTSKHRPWFNWCHWLFGSVAHCLAVFSAFLGMSLGKANVPTWATWVLFIWCIVHLVVVIILEIHGCCMARKNRERREEWEMKRREYPDDYDYMKDPQPKGRRCKCCMLIFYLVITILAVLILLFAIAIY